MANSFTTLGFTLPEVGADTNLWGGHLNGNWTAIDGYMQRFMGTTTTRLLAFNVTAVSTTTTRSMIWRDIAGTVALTSDVPVVRSYLGGLGTSNNAVTPNTKIDVAAGTCTDDTNVQALVLAAVTLDCGTTGANGLDTGSLANSTWYHMFVIGKTDGTTATLASTSISSPTYPSGYTLKRRIGSFKTDGSAHIIAYVQMGDFFEWVTPVADISANNPGTTATTRTLASIPTGLSVLANVQLIMSNSSTTNAVLGSLTDLSMADLNPSAFPDTPNVATAAGNVAIYGGRLQIRTNTSAQIRSHFSFSDANLNISIATFGWVDRRGRDD